MVKDKQKIILELMEKQELMLSEVYQIFAKKFPDYCDFWNELSKEEKDHASWIKGLFKFSENGEVLFHEDNVNVYSLDTFIDYLKGIVDKARMNGMSLRNALSTARDLEMALIEKKAFTHFDSVSDRMKTVLNTLEGKTKEHIDRVNEMVEKVKEETP